MKSTVYLNGRFLRQPVTGVQRFSVEITAAIDRLISEGGWPETIVLTPGPAELNAIRWATSYRHLLFREVGKMRGHIWEQIELPAATRGGILVSLGNTAPLLCGHRQVVVIHDASVFDTPEVLIRSVSVPGIRSCNVGLCGAAYGSSPFPSSRASALPPAWASIRHGSR